MAVTLEAQRLRFARMAFVAVLATSGLAVVPAVARGAGPERAPVKAPSRIGPEPAPVARATATSTPTTTSSTSTRSTTAPPPAQTSSRPVIASTSSAPPRQRPATSARPKPHARPPAQPRANHAVKASVRALAHAVQRPATSLALAAVPTGANGSNRLLFLGGLALLVLVLGDAAFLAMSARVIRDQR